MKIFVTVFLAFASSALSLSIDWENVKPITELEEFWVGRDPIIRAQYKSQSSFRNGRIVNGNIATPGQFPYQVALLLAMDQGVSLCGGSVISSTSVLTAAHCLPNDVSAVEIVFGAQNLRENEPSQQRRMIQRSAFINHPQYNQLTLANDIAVLPFATPVTINPRVQIVALATNNADLFENSEAWVSGFGRYLNEEQRSSDVLRYTDQLIVTNLSCRLRFPTLVLETNICSTGGPQLNAVCHGDSGGPLVVIRNGNPLQVGVVSFGSPLGCTRGTPDVFARVTSFYPWIREVANLH